MATEDEGSSISVEIQLEMQSMRQRLGVICASTGIECPEDGSPENPTAQFLSFIRSLKSSQVSKEQVIYLVYQLVFARIPKHEEIESLVPLLVNEPEEEFLARLLSSDEYKQGPQALVEFEALAANELLVDVSHTLRFAYNSGIQRVVRCLTQNLRLGGTAHKLIELDQVIGNYKVVDDTQAELLFDWEAINDATPSEAISEAPIQPPNNPRESWFKTRLKKLAGRRLRAKFAKLTRRHEAVICSNADAPKEKPQKVLFLWDNNLLLPELIAGQQALDYLLPSLRYTKIKSTLIVFDMISVKNPEYFLTTEGFVRYLALFRFVDRISCISRAVEQDVRNFLPLVDRDRQPPVVTTHYLGGDFSAKDRPEGDTSTQEIEPDSDSKPIVLTVGSIEIRKNHRRILRAMVTAQKAGHRFKGIFAGNPGWLNEGFLKELAYFQNLGFDLELRRSVGEQELLSLYERAAFTVYCSLAEGFGLPIVESVVRGVPCITSDRGCMKEIAEQLGGCLLADPISESDISLAIQRLLGDSASLQRLRDEANQASWIDWAEYARALYSYATEDSQADHVTYVKAA